MKDTIICDLDGTLADCGHRVHHVRNKPKNWDAFYAGIRGDGVHWHIWELIGAMLDCDSQTPYKLVLVSGRPERCRADTRAWLAEKIDPSIDPPLYMRPDGDHRPDYVVKQEILDRHLDKSRILFALDDRQQVVDMWRRNGIPCLQVAEGNF